MCYISPRYILFVIVFCGSIFVISKIYFIEAFPNLCFHCPISLHFFDSGKGAFLLEQRGGVYYLEKQTTSIYRNNKLADLSFRLSKGNEEGLLDMAILSKDNPEFLFCFTLNKSILSNLKVS